MSEPYEEIVSTMKLLQRIADANEHTAVNTTVKSFRDRGYGPIPKFIVTFKHGLECQSCAISKKLEKELNLE